MPNARLPAPSDEAAALSARLVAQTIAAIEADGGWWPFDRYMDQVLYAPGLGYYAAGAHKFGDSIQGGDFVTAPEISPLFAASLSVQVEQVLKLTSTAIVEFGAGSGVFARDLIDALAARGIAVDYSIVEVSAELAQRQQRLLGSRGVRWLDAPPRGFSGVMIANEVLDVMPVRLFAKHDSTVVERGVGISSDRLAFADRDAASELRSSVQQIERVVGPLPDGYCSEIGFTASAWMRSAADWIDSGVLLVIDYGFPRHEYYHPQRLMGTLMCHYRHHAHADPFFLPGLNDLTAHVDFSAAADAAHDGGLDVLGYTSQASFLLNCNLLDRVGNDPRRASEANRLVSEAEMGELVKVLAVGRGVTAPLVGFSRGDRTHRL